jgi:hypothetical protein
LCVVSWLTSYPDSNTFDFSNFAGFNTKGRAAIASGAISGEVPSWLAQLQASRNSGRKARRAVVRSN